MKNNYVALVGSWFRERRNFILDTRDGITSEAEYVFTNGQCHSLAVAIHDLTGWNLVQVEGGRHVMVQKEDGTFVDICGLHEYMDLSCQCDAYYDSSFDCECVENLTRDEIIEGLPHYLPCDPENAKPYAEMVLKTYFGDMYIN